jgi:hypothetical protein
MKMDANSFVTIAFSSGRGIHGFRTNGRIHQVAGVDEPLENALPATLVQCIVRRVFEYCIEGSRSK